LGVGDRVETFDGFGSVTSWEVAAIQGDCVELSAIGAPRPGCSSPISLTLATAVPKGDRFDWLIEKATELGVERLIPMITDRSVVEPRGSKVERLRRLIIEASKQCGRARLMILDEPTRWMNLANSFAGSSKFLADPGGAPPPQWPAIPRTRPLVLAVGPEGGFSDGEQSLALQAGWVAINLGVYTLRIETAGIAGSVALLNRISESRD
jgi:16S rRNA (uracil1498-N3)-methyltransferase